MPTAYHLYTITTLPRGPRFGTEDQLYLTIDGHESRENVHTTLNRNAEAFRKMNVANLAAAGLFGPRVDKSEEFVHAEKHGSLHSLNATYPFKGADYFVTITESGSLIVYDALETEEEGVDVLCDIKTRLFDKCSDMG